VLVPPRRPRPAAHFARKTIGVIDRARTNGHRPAGPYTGSPPGHRCRMRRAVLDREADLPAEEAQARPYPRVSRSHANPRWARGDSPTPPEGPQAAHALMAGSGARRRRQRLTRSGDFDRVFRDGSSRGNRFLVLYAFPRRDDPESGARLGISVGRKVGGAVQRNAVKRALREAFWSSADELAGAHDFVLVARPDAAGLVEREGADGVRAALEELVADGGPAAGERST
jgi:ribonuclease P protein component